MILNEKRPAACIQNPRHIIHARNSKLFSVILKIALNDLCHARDPLLHLRQFAWVQAEALQEFEGRDRHALLGPMREGCRETIQDA